MNLAAIAHLRETTELKYEAAEAILRRFARSEAEIEGWEENDGSARVWAVLRRGEGYGITRASIETARANALCEAEGLAEIVLLNAIHDTAGDVLDVLAALHKAMLGDPDEVADLVDEAESADDLGREGRFKLAMIDAARAVRAAVHEAVARMAAALGDQGMDRDEAEQSIREMVFEDEP